MAALIILLILILLAFFILLATNLSRTSEQKKITGMLYDRINHLSNEISDLTKEIRNLKQQPSEKNIPVEEKPLPRSATPIIPTVKNEVKEEPKKAITPEIEKPQPISPVIEIKGKEKAVTDIKENSKIIASTPKPATDLEKFIGENIVNKIGIAVLVLGISFFVKYAIDREMITETGRVITGMIAGLILIGIAHRIRNSYRSFSSVLVGGGLTVFYFTIAYAFHQYQLVGQKSAFAIMLLITILAVILSLYYDRLELAVLATIGGFITPFLVRGEQENYVALFSYLCILNAGLMTLAWFKRWTSINMIALFFTIIIYGGWLVDKLLVNETTQFPYKHAMLFAILFYLQFVAMNVVNNIREKKSFIAFDFIVLLSINFLFYLAGIFILDFWNDGKQKGLFTAMLGIFNLLLVLTFRQKKTIDRNFISLLTGLTLTFISLTAPVQFKGNHVVLFWAAETTVLFWLYRQTRIIQLKVASLVVAVLMLASLIITWLEVYFSGQGLIPVFLNKGFTTTLVSSAAIFINYKLMYKEADTFYLYGYRNKTVRGILLGIFIILLYLCGALEIFYQFSTRFIPAALNSIYLQLYSFSFSIIFLLIFKKHSVYPMMKFLFTVLCFGLYIINISTNYEVSIVLSGNDESALFLAHWVSVVLLVWLMQDFTVYFKKNEMPDWKPSLPAFTWLSSIGIVLILSVEMYQLNLWMNFHGDEWSWWKNLYYKAGLSILWGICSFFIMWLGMHFRFRPLRIISLTLFTVTISKLFTYDIRNIPPGGKITAFILLGILLLTVSFMYQRLKKIIIDEKVNDSLPD